MKLSSRPLRRGMLWAALGASFVARAAFAGEVPAARVAHFAGDRAAAISYTFDDGLRDQYTVAVPMLNEAGLKGTFFVIPGAIAETVDAAEKKQAQRRAWGGITWAELKEMAAQGHEIASHTWSHPNLQKLSEAELDAQFSKAYEAIKTHIGTPPLTLAFPFNASTPEVKDAALKYHVAFRSYQTATGDKTTLASLNAWADKQVTEKKWGVIMVHGIAQGYAALSDPEILRAHWKYVKGRERDIWVDTLANIARYEKERDDAKLGVTGEPGKVTVTLAGTLDMATYNVPLTVVLDAPGAISARAARGGRPVPVRVENGSLYLETVPGPEPVLVYWK